MNKDTHLEKREVTGVRHRYDITVTFEVVTSDEFGPVTESDIFDVIDESIHRGVRQAVRNDLGGKLRNDWIEIDDRGEVI